MDTFDYIIVGSGISGISFAHHKAKSGKKVLVLEKKEYAGGCLRSLTHDDFWLEMGGHTIYNSYLTYIKTLRELGIEEKFLPRSKAGFKMFKDGKVVPIMSALSKIEAAFNVPKMFFMKKQGRTVKDYYSAILGENNYSNMFSPMLQAVISQDASDFPADMLLKKRDRDKSAPRNFTLTGGMSTFINAVSAMENVTVKTDCEVVDIKSDGGKYTVETHSGEKFQSDNITMACPPPTAGRLLANVAPAVSELLLQIKGVKVETMGVIVDKKDITLDPFSFIIAKDEIFTSVVSRDIIPHEKYRGFAFHFRATGLDKETKLTKIEDVLGIDRSAIVAKAETVHFSPTLGMDHKSRLKALDEKLKEQKGLYIIGNYFGGIAIEDCAIRASECASL